MSAGQVGTVGLVGQEPMEAVVGREGMDGMVELEGPSHFPMPVPHLCTARAQASPTTAVEVDQAAVPMGVQLGLVELVVREAAEGRAVPSQEAQGQAPQGHQAVREPRALPAWQATLGHQGAQAAQALADRSSMATQGRPQPRFPSTPASCTGTRAAAWAASPGA
jgi:hypothetical protein